jgi:hypothetical protein
VADEVEVVYATETGGWRAVSMNRKFVAAGVLGLLLVAVGIGAAVYLGLGPASGGASDEELTAFPTATAAADGADDTGSPVAASPDTAPFAFTIEEVETCGQTCRDVTATLHNNQDSTATGVTVFTRVFAGQKNTDTDDLVWEGNEKVGTVKAGGSHTSTNRVELSYQEGLEIERNDGWVTIVTTVQTDDRTVTFRDSEQVA